MEVDGSLGICEPILAYAWAVIFMLRCAEVAAVRWVHVSVDKSKKIIALRIPISKTDQSGWGVFGMLRHAQMRLDLCLEGVGGDLRSKSEFVFVDNFEGAKSTRNMAQAWKSKLKAEMSGHSARRSGAVMYVRAGLPLQEVAFLGRWQSNVVLTYAEEALEEVPANQRLIPAARASSSKDFPGWKSPRTPRPSAADLGCDRPVPMTF